MTTTGTKSNRVKRMAGVVVAGSMGLAGLLAGPAMVANADPVVVLNGETVAPPKPPPLVSPWPGGAWAGWDWSKGWPGGGYANGKAGGAWNHTK